MKKKEGKIVPISAAQGMVYDAAAEMDVNVIGLKIREARKKKGLSIAGFTERLKAFGCEVSVGAAGKWELGYSVPNAYQLVAICLALDIEDQIPFFMKNYTPALNSEGERKVQEYLNEGLSQEEAEKEALGWVARPGCSEHETGLAVDINANNSLNTQETFSWLKENSWQYGFVQRYPIDKAAITGTYNEEWHYRYVGLEAAKAMHQRNQCLEEYLGVR